MSNSQTVKLERKATYLAIYIDCKRAWLLSFENNLSLYDKERLERLTQYSKRAHALANRLFAKAYF